MHRQPLSTKDGSFAAVRGTPYPDYAFREPFQRHVWRAVSAIRRRRTAYDGGHCSTRLH